MTESKIEAQKQNRVPHPLISKGADFDWPFPEFLLRAERASELDLWQTWHKFCDKSSKIVALGEPTLSAQRLADLAFFDAWSSVEKPGYSGVTQGTI